MVNDVELAGSQANSLLHSKRVTLPVRQWLGDTELTQSVDHKPATTSTRPIFSTDVFPKLESDYEEVQMRF